MDDTIVKQRMSLCSGDDTPITGKDTTDSPTLVKQPVPTNHSYPSKTAAPSDQTNYSGKTVSHETMRTGHDEKPVDSMKARWQGDYPGKRDIAPPDRSITKNELQSTQSVVPDVVPQHENMSSAESNKNTLHKNTNAIYENAERKLSDKSTPPNSSAGAGAKTSVSARSTGSNQESADRRGRNAGAESFHSKSTDHQGSYTRTGTTSNSQRTGYAKHSINNAMETTMPPSSNGMGGYGGHPNMSYVMPPHFPPHYYAQPTYPYNNACYPQMPPGAPMMNSDPRQMYQGHPAQYYGSNGASASGMEASKAVPERGARSAEEERQHHPPAMMHSKSSPDGCHYYSPNQMMMHGGMFPPNMPPYQLQQMMMQMQYHPMPPSQHQPQYGVNTTYPPAMNVPYNHQYHGMHPYNQHVGMSDQNADPRMMPTPEPSTATPVSSSHSKRSVTVTKSLSVPQHYPSGASSSESLELASDLYGIHTDSSQKSHSSRHDSTNIELPVKPISGSNSSPSKECPASLLPETPQVSVCISDHDTGDNNMSMASTYTNNYPFSEAVYSLKDIKYEDVRFNHLEMSDMSNLDIKAGTERWREEAAGSHRGDCGKGDVNGQARGDSLMSSSSYGGSTFVDNNTTLSQSLSDRHSPSSATSSVLHKPLS